MNNKGNNTFEIRIGQFNTNVLINIFKSRLNVLKEIYMIFKDFYCSQIVYILEQFPEQEQK